jgi:uncharacterized protein YPO0396
MTNNNQITFKGQKNKNKNHYVKKQDIEATKKLIDEYLKIDYHVTDKEMDDYNARYREWFKDNDDVVMQLINTRYSKKDPHKEERIKDLNQELDDRDYQTEQEPMELYTQQLRQQVQKGELTLQECIERTIQYGTKLDNEGIRENEIQFMIRKSHLISMLKYCEVLNKGYTRKMRKIRSYRTGKYYRPDGYSVYSVVKHIKSMQKNQDNIKTLKQDVAHIIRLQDDRVKRM